MKPLLTVLLCLVAAAASAGSGKERSPAVYPAQRIPLVFEHDKHLSEGAECETCHENVKKSVQVSDWNLPKHPECETCHDIAEAKKGKKVDPRSSCQTCHPGFDETVQKAPVRLELPAAHLKFDHSLHVAKKVKCETCHGDLHEVGLATRMQLPKMATCLTCHDGSSASSACKTCHLQAPSGRLQLKFDSGLMIPQQGNPQGMDHGPRFEFTHATRAALARDTCMECHARNECNACHDSLQKPLSVHPNDFITLHPIQARQDLTRCESCHRTQSFCAACHERTGVGMNAERRFRPLNVRVHPDYATWVDNLGPGHHGIAASRDIKQCSSCHREETCLACHSEASRFGTRNVVNPHPAGFAQSCKKMAAKNDRACLKCHQESSLETLGCR